MAGKKKKVFPKSALSVTEPTPAGNTLLAPLVDASAEFPVLEFPIGNGSHGRRTHSFARWYGVGTDEITAAFQSQLQWFLHQSGMRRVNTVHTYCQNGARTFLEYVMLLSAAVARPLALIDIDAQCIRGYILFLRTPDRQTTSQRACYVATKAILSGLSKRGRIVLSSEGPDRTFPVNPYPKINQKYKGAKPYSKLERTAIAGALRTAVRPLFDEDVEPTTDMLCCALLLIALHTGRNTAPLLELDVDCIRPHPKDQLQFLFVFKWRGYATSRVPLRDVPESDSESVSAGAVAPQIATLIRRIISLSARLRLEAPEHIRGSIWLFRRRRSGPHISLLTPELLSQSVKKLVTDHNLVDSDSKALTINVGRLRKTFGNRIFELSNQDLVVTAAALGNSPAVASNHYLRPGEGAERNWMFMGRHLANELRTGTIGATERTPAGRCADTRSGQYAPHDGSACMNFTNCLRCKAYVVTGDDLYRLFSFYFRVLAERNRMDKQKWKRQYGHIIRLVDRDVIAAGVTKGVFKERAVDVARQRARTNPHPFWGLEFPLENSSD